MNQNEILTHIIGCIDRNRKFGQCYVAKPVRDAVKERWDAIPTAHIGERGVRLYWTGWGRSLESGGHKYKSYAVFRDTGKPVASKDLGKIEA